MGGMVLETNMSEIIARIEEQNLIEKQEVITKNRYVLYDRLIIVCLTVRPDGDQCRSSSCRLSC